MARKLRYEKNGDGCYYVYFDDQCIGIVEQEGRNNWTARQEGKFRRTSHYNRGEAAEALIKAKQAAG